MMNLNRCFAPGLVILCNAVVAADRPITGHHQHGVESMRMEGQYPGSRYDPAKCPFWPAVFRRNGYQIAHIDKWHTGVDSGSVATGIFKLSGTGLDIRAIRQTTTTTSSGSRVARDSGFGMSAAVPC